jgi:hypothetical protein
MGTPSLASPRNSLLVSYLGSNGGVAAPNAPSTGALLTALNRAYKNGEAAIWLHNSSLLKFTRPESEDGEEQGPGVKELANRVWEHARRRAEDQVIVVRYALNHPVRNLMIVGLQARERQSRLKTCFPI